MALDINKTDKELAKISNAQSLSRMNKAQAVVPEEMGPVQPIQDVFASGPVAGQFTPEQVATLSSGPLGGPRKVAPAGTHTTMTGAGNAAVAMGVGPQGPMGGPRGANESSGAQGDLLGGPRPVKSRVEKPDSGRGNVIGSSESDRLRGIEIMARTYTITELSKKQDTLTPNLLSPILTSFPAGPVPATSSFLCLGAAGPVWAPAVAGLDLTKFLFGMTYSGAAVTISDGELQHGQRGNIVVWGVGPINVTLTDSYFWVSYVYGSGVASVQGPSADPAAVVSDGTTYRRWLYKFTLTAGLISGYTIGHIGAIDIPGTFG